MSLKTVYEYAQEYTGADWTKGEVILDFLIEEGLQPEHRVLDVGCGCLAEGRWLIRHLDVGNYTGLDPNGWLISAGLDEEPELQWMEPEFVVRGDFDVVGDFDMVVAHSVLSHVSLPQLQQALRNIRRNVQAGGVWLASLRLGDDDFDPVWRYPDVSFFSLGTLAAYAAAAGWRVEHVPEYCERLMAVSPADVHDWVRLVAT